MRDLAARLREIVKANTRELTVSAGDAAAEVPSRLTLAEAAEQLGGRLHESHGSTCIVMDRTWDDMHWHGRRRVGAMAIDKGAPLLLFDPRLRSASGWTDQIVYFDLETTGLSGGAGTLAFLAGCGWFSEDGFTVRQFLLTGANGERAMLDALADIFEAASLLVTFNGKTFDVPLMEMRWAFHRRSNAADDLPHFDMLPPARRLWARREGRADRLWAEDGSPAEAASSCSLSSLERSVLGFHRVGDVPGFEIPTRYFHFLRTGAVEAIAGVLEHNQHDLVSLAALVSHALSLAVDGPEACRDATEQVALGRLYERAGDAERAAHAYEAAAASDDRDVRAHALSRLAVLMRQQDRHGEAAAAWQGVLEDLEGTRRPLTRAERCAAEALAIHHEHRVKNPVEAKRYADVLRRDVVSRPPARAAFPQLERMARDVEHRLGRLDRKIESKNAKGGPEAAPLLHDVDRT